MFYNSFVHHLRFVVLFLVCGAALFGQHKTRNLVLVTADGLRWQEVFRGIDPALMEREDAGMKDAADVRARFWADSVEERRSKLFPFLWSTVAKKGVILGDRDNGAQVNVRNGHRFSYPGYSEILTGKPQDDLIDSNDMKPNPSRTSLQVLREELSLPHDKVAAFASWSVFEGIVASKPGEFEANAGYHALDVKPMTPRLTELSQAQFELLTDWPSVRHDYITLETALEYMRSKKPRVLYVALGETDDWAHERRYDRTLETAHYFDTALGKLWSLIQHDSAYRDKTTLIVTTDHGRGASPEDWNSHGAKVAGAEGIWIAAIGPDTPATGVAGKGSSYTQSDVAPTMLELVGVSPSKLEGAVGKPIDLIVGR